MYKHCNTEESALRQRQLEGSLLELMAETPLAHITIGQVCQRAGVSRKSFYRYFDSKDGCLHALLDHTIMDGFSYYMPETDSVDLTLHYCIRIFEFWRQQTPLLDALEKNAQSLQLLQRMVRYILMEEPEYARFMGIAPDLTMEHVVYTVGGVMGLVLTWHHEGFQKTAEQMGHVMFRLSQNPKMQKE